MPKRSPSRKELDPVTPPVIPPVEPPAKPKRPRKRKPRQLKTSGVDWYAIGLAVLALITIAPYVLPLLRDVKPTPAVSFDESAGNVANWFSNVASDDPKADLPKYVESLRSVASAEISDVAKIDEVLKDEVEVRLGRVGWLNWGLFNIELLKEIRRLRDEKKLEPTVKAHQAFLSAVADALAKVGE
jgi:hypothetical protein